MKLAFPVATPDTADRTMLALRGELGECFQLLARLGSISVEVLPRPDAAEAAALAARHLIPLLQETDEN